MLSGAAAADGAGAAGDDPRAWLARADQALTTLNYEGVFVHEHGGETETLRVIHRVGSEGVSERLLSMDGSGREFIRKGSLLTCYLPDQRAVLVEKSTGAGLLLGNLPRVDASSAREYEVRQLRQARVSGRNTRVIAITPMDELRYGYQIWIDEATSMPLKTQLRTRHGEVLEQIVFTDLRLPAHIVASELEPAVDARNYRWVRHDADTVDARGLSVSWQSESLPPGFRMTVSTRQVLPGGPVEHLVFSDGLASVSVFVELGRDPGSERVKDDAAALGSSSAFSTVVQGYRVTAVGEVPADTVRAIAQSIRTAAAAPGLGESVAAGASRTDEPVERGSFSSAVKAAAAGGAGGAALFGSASGQAGPGVAGSAAGGGPSAATDRH